MNGPQQIKTKSNSWFLSTWPSTSEETRTYLFITIYANALTSILWRLNYQPSKMTTIWAPHLIPVAEFSIHVKEELMQSTSENHSIFHMIARKAFVIHHFLKNANILLVVSTVFDCMFGCGSGTITVGIYKSLEPFGPILLIPVMSIATIILGFNSCIYDGILNKFFQALITLNFMVSFKKGIKDLFRFLPISYDSYVQCIIEKCDNCQALFLQPLLSSKRICTCVCESCLKRSDECTKCLSSPCTGNICWGQFVELEILPITQGVCECEQIPYYIQQAFLGNTGARSPC